jgi:hypothetical protein
MSRYRLALASVLVTGTFAWVFARPDAPTPTLEPTEIVAVAEFGENTEDVARHRWQHNAPRHWRSLVVKR